MSANGLFAGNWPSHSSQKESDSHALATFLRTQVQEGRCSPPVGPAHHVVGHNFHHGSLADSLPILKIMADEDALRNIDVTYPWARLHLDERQLPPLSLLAPFNLGNNLQGAVKSAKDASHRTAHARE